MPVVGAIGRASGDLAKRGGEHGAPKGAERARGSRALFSAVQDEDCWFCAAAAAAVVVVVVVVGWWLGGGGECPRGGKRRLPLSGNESESRPHRER